MTNDGDRRLSEEAQDAGDHPRENASDPGQSGVPWKGGSCLVKFLWSVLIAAGFVGVVIAVTAQLEDSTDGSEAPSDSATVSTVANQGAASDESPGDTDGSASDSAGPIGGTWDMYWTNIEGNESVGFTLRFMDDEYGTVEFPYDDRPYDARWDINGDQISFGFARDFDGPSGFVTEWSSFEGTLVKPGLITGNWLRDDWSCTPDDGCSTKPVPSSSDSRLVRQP